MGISKIEEHEDTRHLDNIQWICDDATNWTSTIPIYKFSPHTNFTMNNIIVTNVTMCDIITNVTMNNIIVTNDRASFKIE